MPRGMRGPPFNPMMGYGRFNPYDLMMGGINDPYGFPDEYMNYMPANPLMNPMPPLQQPPGMGNQQQMRPGGGYPGAQLAYGQPAPQAVAVGGHNLNGFGAAGAPVPAPPPPPRCFTVSLRRCAQAAPVKVVLANASAQDIINTYCNSQHGKLLYHLPPHGWVEQEPSRMLESMVYQAGGEQNVYLAVEG
ncbi:hypothetical protein LTR22_025987 [Elasticomyces elasticus]|nr:hypothetical protein LTR22_025987 [Elasticomyces elasticus]KAK4921235.1 hypothetical protein LTR49_011238 [Elasticomyces elasticus]KAK5735127.1 hypothetical protein LTS12_026545 [Elasticomyces elasticus]